MDRRITWVFEGDDRYLDTVSLQYVDDTVRDYGNITWNKVEPNKDHHLDADDFIVSVTWYVYRAYLGVD